MGKISDLPDESLLKILSFLPTKVAVSTSILSKRWECLSMWLPKLEFYFRQYSESGCERLQCFLHRSLALHKAPVLESLHFKFCDSHFKPEDIKLWIVVAASRCLRELEISRFSYSQNIISILPSSLYTNKSLVILKLSRGILLEVVPRNACLPSLKTLQLQSVAYANKESLQRLLSICPVLEDLYVDLLMGLQFINKMKKFTIFVPYLLRLTIYIRYCEYDEYDVEELVINTPSLVYFKLDEYSRHYYMIENMPKLVEAYVYAKDSNLESLIGSTTSVKRLSLGLKNPFKQVVYGDDFFFNQLEHLELRLYKPNATMNLIRMLKDSPNLRALGLFIVEDEDECYDWWTEPAMVPECVLSSLQIFKWSRYKGSPEERDLTVYMLQNARCLRTVTISLYEEEVPEVEMIKELALSSRASATCQLMFV